MHIGKRTIKLAMLKTSGERTLNMPGNIETITIDTLLLGDLSTLAQCPDDISGVVNVAIHLTRVN